AFRHKTCNEICFSTARSSDHNRNYTSDIMQMPKGLYLRWLEEPSGTPQVLGSTPRGSEFQVEVKKTPSPASFPKHCGARPNSQGDGPPCTGGAGVRGFSWPAVRRSFYLSKQCRGGGLTPRRSSFFLHCEDGNISR